MISIRDINESDFDRILMLNESEVQQTSPMDLARLGQLVGLSVYHRVAVAEGEVAGFLLAMPDGVAYDSDNYRWFADQFSHFAYVDRIVVDAGFSGRGIGSRLYQDLFRFARSIGKNTITCEYNIDPPNPGSRAFHDKFGFREIGTQWVADDTKQVSLQIVDI